MDGKAIIKGKIECEKYGPIVSESIDSVKACSLSRARAFEFYLKIKKRKMI